MFLKKLITSLFGKKKTKNKPKLYDVDKVSAALKNIEELEDTRKKIDEGFSKLLKEINEIKIFSHDDPEKLNNAKQNLKKAREKYEEIYQISLIPADNDSTPIQISLLLQVKKDMESLKNLPEKKRYIINDNEITKDLYFKKANEHFSSLPNTSKIDYFIRNYIISKEKLLPNK